MGVAALIHGFKKLKEIMNAPCPHYDKIILRRTMKFKRVSKNKSIRSLALIRNKRYKKIKSRMKRKYYKKLRVL